MIIFSKTNIEIQRIPWELVCVAFSFLHTAHRKHIQKIRETKIDGENDDEEEEGKKTRIHSVVIGIINKVVQVIDVYVECKQL